MACPWACCRFYGKPTRDFLGRNLRRIPDAIWSPFSESQLPCLQIDMISLPHMGLLLGFKKRILGTVFSTVSHISRSSRMNDCYLFSLSFSKQPSVPQVLIYRRSLSSQVEIFTIQPISSFILLGTFYHYLYII